MILCLTISGFDSPSRNFTPQTVEVIYRPNGYHTIESIADFYDEIKEINETNNFVEEKDIPDLADHFIRTSAGHPDSMPCMPGPLKPAQRKAPSRLR